MSQVLLAFRELAVLAALAATLFVSGRMVARRFPFDGVAEELSTAIGLGLGLLGTLLFLLAALHLLFAGVLWVAFGTVHAIGWKVWRDLFRRARRRGVHGLRPSPQTIGLALVAVPAFVLALYPPHAFDETLYHLPFAKAFALHHGFVFLETLRFPIFPQLAEVLSAALLILSGEVSTHLPSWIAFFAVALAVAAWAQSQEGTPSGIWAAALWLGTPLAVFLAASAYVDLPLTLFASLSWIYWDRWRRQGRSAFLALAAAFAGFAAATKYVGLLVVGLLAVGTLVVAFRRRRLRPLLLFLAIAFGALAPWYLRNLIETGNPVFPLLPDLFGANAWMQPADMPVWQGSARHFPVSVAGYLLRRVGKMVLHPAASLLWPWTAAFRPAAFNHQAPLSPLFPLVAVLALAGACWLRGLRPLLLFCGAFFLLSPTLDPRFLLPIVTLLGGAASIALARGLQGFRVRTSNQAMLALAAFFAIPGMLYAARRIWIEGPPPAGPEARESYLSRQVAGYQTLELLNRQKGNAYTVYGLFCENLAYFAHGRFLGDWVGPYRFQRVLDSFGSGTALAQALRAMGANYFLVNQARLPLKLPEDESFHRRFRLIATSGPVALYELVGEETP